MSVSGARCEHVLDVNERPRAVGAFFARFGSIGPNAELPVSELVGEPVSGRRFADGFVSHVAVETVAELFGNGVTVRALRRRRVTKYAVIGTQQQWASFVSSCCNCHIV